MRDRLLLDGKNGRTHKDSCTLERGEANEGLEGTNTNCRKVLAQPLGETNTDVPGVCDA